LLIIGLASWRLTLIAFCNNDKKGTLAAGKKAVEALDRAEEEGADRYITSAHRALTYQLLAGLGGFKNGALYGKLSASALKKVTSEKPDGYFTRLIKAINTSQAPRFAGGNPEKAAELFSSLRKEYPDSTDLTVHLAETYRKLKKYKEARVLLKPVIDQRPSNLLARKTLNDIPRKK
jgi:tetratricopeptide (TPR) repeat protein